VEPQERRRPSPLSIRLDVVSRAALAAHATASGMGPSAWAASVVRAAIRGAPLAPASSRLQVIRAATAELGRLANAIDVAAAHAPEFAEVRQTLESIDASLREAAS
jgi:hypothetical protein